MADTDRTADTKDHSESTNSTAPTSVTSEKQSTGRSRESTSNYASSSSGASRGRPRTRSDLSNPLSAANLEKSLINAEHGARGYHTFNVLGKDFHVDKRWKFVRELGQGAYGIVVYVKSTFGSPASNTPLSSSLAQDTISGENVAIKLVTRVFDKKELAKRALREIVLLRHFNHHENITGLIDMDLLSPDFNEIYLFMEPMEADLHQIIRSGQTLTNAHVQYFLYQILRGCKYIHSANVVHRDLKPGNLLVNADCELKICDLGLSRGFDRNTLPGHEEESVSHLTEYVATRWYRAPEIMLSFRRYGPAIDVWSIGCILGELLGGKPMFKGKDYVDQLNLILKTLGTPEERTIKRIGSEKAQAYIRSLPIKHKVPLPTLFPSADPLALDLLEKMLAFDPTDRITVMDALAHPYLESYHEIGDEPVAPIISEKWRQIEEVESDFEYRKAIWKEVYEFRLSVRSAENVEGSTDMMAHEHAVFPEEVVEDDNEEGVAHGTNEEREKPLPPPPTDDEEPTEKPRDDTPEATGLPPRVAVDLPESHLPPPDLALAPSLAEIEEATDALPPNATLPRTPLDPIPLTVPFPTVDEGHDDTLPLPRLHARAPSSSSTLRPHSASAGTVDPYTAYARRTSFFFTPAQSQKRLQGESSVLDEAVTESVEGDRVVSMRSRAPSMDGGSLLRTLSTGGLSKLGEKVEGGVPVITPADQPPSALPTEFKGGRESASGDSSGDK
ncbi:hypothetical protein FRB99_002754 [Tulasnella sp. 403]|nr:hypothetical protein FRB99_002754 [Tulasnella sp. 403]